MFKRIAIATAVAALALLADQFGHTGNSGYANADSIDIVGRACSFRGGRGYNNPRGSECRGQYNIRANSFANGRLSFYSDGRTWLFQCYAATGECDIFSITPPTRTPLTGQIAQDADGDVNGWYHSQYCGRGWISLTLEGCD